MKKLLKFAGCTTSDSPAQVQRKLKAYYGMQAFEAAGAGKEDLPAEESVKKFTNHQMEMSRKLRMEKAGCMESSSDDEKVSKLFQHYGRQKMEAAGVKDNMPAKEALERFNRHMDAEEEMEAGAAGAKGGDSQLEDPVVIEGAPTRIEEPPLESNLVGGRGMERGSGSPQKEQISALSEQVRRQREQIQQFESKLQQREKADKKKAGLEAVDSAWSLGQIVPHKNETEAQAKERFLRHYERGEDAFRDALAPEGTHATIEQTRTRLTRGGLPLNFERGAGADEDLPEGTRPDDQIIKRAEELRTKHPKMSRQEAVRKVCMERPGLGAAYRHQSKAALFE